MFSVRKSVNFRDYCHFLVGCHYKKIKTITNDVAYSKRMLVVTGFNLGMLCYFFNYLLEFTLPISSSLSVIYKECLKPLYYSFRFPYL